VSIYTVRLKASAQKEYDKLPKAERLRVLDRLLELEDNPRPSGVETLSGEFRGLHRVRVGDYRIIYEISDTARMVSVARIRPRGRAYQ
jgi:mRNA interferase RelE/StbE